MSKKVITIDPNRCTGCRVCELACSLKKEGACSPLLSRVRVITVEKEGLDLPFLCLHCADAPCAIFCPVMAISEDEKTGAVVVNDDLCIGCGACIVACPFGVIFLDPQTKGKRILKCDLCNGEPDCVRFCESRALDFVRREKVSEGKCRKAAELYASILGGEEAKKKMRSAAKKPTGKDVSV